MKPDSVVPARAAVPFRLKLFVFGGVLALAPVVVLGVGALSISRDGVKTLTRELQLAVASDLARTIDAQLGAAQDGLDLVGRTLLDPDLTEDRAIADALRLVASIAAIDHAGVYDATGTLVDAMKEDTLAVHHLPERLDGALLAAATARGVATGRVRGGTDGVRVLLVVPMRVQQRLSGFAATARWK